MKPLTPHCQHLSSPGLPNFAISLVILLGILLSYLPQHIRIVLRRSSFGLSPYFVLLGTISGTCALANILTLPTSRKDLACCKDISGYACFASILGIAQVGVQWSCFTAILFLFLIFFPRATPSDPIHPENSNAPTYRTALAVTGTCILHALVTSVLSLYFIYARPQYLQNWANILGIIAAILALIQYFPQIYTTWRLQRVGSLSIPMMCIQTPGSFVFAASLAARLGAAGWSAWGVYCFTGCLQGVLLFMAITFELRARREKEASAETANGHLAHGDQANGPTEQTPLIGDDERLASSSF